MSPVSSDERWRLRSSDMGSISIWDEEAALQSCWFDCESHPTAAYSYPSNDQDFRYLTGYRL